MSSLSHDDTDLHLAGAAHRWAAPSGVEKSVWEARVRAHIADHILAGWPPEPGYVRPYVPPSPAEDFLLMWFGPDHVDGSAVTANRPGPSLGPADAPAP